MHKRFDNQGWKTYLTKKKRYAGNDQFLSNDAGIIRTTPTGPVPYFKESRHEIISDAHCHSQG